MVAPDLLNVNPVTLGNVPIVGVTDVAPLYAITFVVVVMALGIFPSCSALNVCFH